MTNVVAMARLSASLSALESMIVATREAFREASPMEEIYELVNEIGLEASYILQKRDQMLGISPPEVIPVPEAQSSTLYAGGDK